VPTKAIQTSNAECFARFPVINHFENQLQLLSVRTANKFSSVPWKEKGEKKSVMRVKSCWFGFSEVQWPAFVKAATDLPSKYPESATTNENQTYQTTVHSIITYYTEWNRDT
jgi:hypothetical protein